MITPYFLLSALLAVAAHEAGHIAAAHAFGLRVKRCGFSLWPFGFYIVRESAKPLQDALVSLSGPMVNLLLASLFCGAHEFALMNMVLGVTNLAPFPHTDGRRVMNLLEAA